MLNGKLTKIKKTGKFWLNVDNVSLVLIACSAEKMFLKDLILSTKPCIFWRKRKFPPKTPAIRELRSERLVHKRVLWRVVPIVFGVGKEVAVDQQ